MSTYELEHLNTYWGRLRKSVKIGLIGTTIIIYSITLIGCGKKEANIDSPKPQDNTVVITKPESLSKSNEAAALAEAETNKAKEQVTAAVVDNSGGSSGGTVLRSAEPGNIGTTSTKPVTPSSGTSTSKPATTPSESTQPPSTPTTPTAPSTAIKTQYGSHTYGTKSQAEYDAVMQKVKAAINNSSIAPVNPLIAKYDAGVRSATMDKTDPDYRNMLILEKGFGSFLDSTSAKYHENAIRGGGLSSYFTASTTQSSAANSAYDVIFNKIGKCTGDAQVMSAVYDAMGFSTQVRGSDGDAKCYVKIDGQWYRGGSLVVASPTGVTVSGPTY